MEHVDGPRSGWWVGSPLSKPYGQEGDDSQRKTGLLRIKCMLGPRKQQTQKSPHEIHFRILPSKPSCLFSPIDFLVGGQNGEAYSLTTLRGQKQCFLCYLWCLTCRQGKGNTVEIKAGIGTFGIKRSVVQLVYVWEKVVTNGTEAVSLSSFSNQPFLKSSKCLSGSLGSILS